MSEQMNPIRRAHIAMMCHRVGKMFGLSDESIARIQDQMLADATAPTPSQVKAAVDFEKRRGSGDAATKARKVENHLSERSTYYGELERMLDVPMFASMSGGPYIGPKGGKWANPEFTIPWHEQGGEGAPQQQNQPPGQEGAGAQPKQPKTLPTADAIGQQGMQVVAAIRQHDPKAADQLEGALNEIVTQLRARQAGAKSPEGDSRIIENLKAFGRAFSQSAAPASVLGPDLGGMLEAAERTAKRTDAENARQQGDAMKEAAGRAGSAISSAGQSMRGPAPNATQGAPAPTSGGEEKFEIPTAPPAKTGKEDDGVVDLFGIGTPEQVNARYGGAAKPGAGAAGQDALARLDQSAGPIEGETAREMEGVHQMAGARDREAQSRQQGQQESAAFDRDLATARSKKQAVEQAAAAQADRWASRQKGRPTMDVVREQLGGPADAPAKPAIPPERAEARTAAGPRRGAPPAPSEGNATVRPGRGQAPPPAGAAREEDRTRRPQLARSMITPTMVKAMVGDRMGPVPPVGPTNGASPAETSAIPDYQNIYFQPPDSDRKRREEEAVTNRRQADGERTRGAFGFHGTGDVRVDPILFYVPSIRPAAQVYGPRLSQQRAPIVVSDMQKPRLEAGGPTMPKDGSPIAAQTDAGRVPRSADRREDILAGAQTRPEPRLTVPVDASRPSPAETESSDTEAEDEQEQDDTEEDEEETEKSESWWEAMAKASPRMHKYVRRIPTGDPKRPWRYFYAESAIARDVTEGEEVRIGKEIAKVVHVDKDGTIRIEMGGQQRAIQPDEWSNLLARSYGTRFHAWAETRAERSINAVLKHVPRSMLEDLPGDTDEARFDALKSRVPEVYAKLDKAFKRAGVNPFRAKQILAQALERRGWEPDARAAAVGSVLTKRTSATRFSEIVRGAENLAGGDRVSAGHVATVVELRGNESFADNVAAIASRAEAELGQLSALLSKARDGSNDDRAQALAQALAASAIAKLNLLTQAFPGLKDSVATQAREVMLEAASAAPHIEPKSEGAKTHVYVAGDGGQPKAIHATYRLIDAGDLIASHDPLKSFTKRSEYPDNVQERAYHRDQSEQGKVIRNAQLLNPSFVANTNPDAVNGPPVVMKMDKGLIVLGGNSRTMSMQRAYEHHEKKGEELSGYLADHAHEFGFRPEDVKAMKRPVLVREIEPEDRSKSAQQVLVRQLNESFTQGMDPRTLQVAMGRKLDDNALAAIGSDMKDDETLATFLASPRSERFVNALERAGVIDQRNANQYLKKGTKLLNEDGRTLVERILVGRLVGDADVLSNTGPKLVGNIAAAVPYMVQAKAHGKGYDVGSDMAIALSAYNDLHHRVETGAIPALDPKMDDKRFKGLFNYFDSLFGDKHPVVDNPDARALLELLIRKPGPQQQAAVWREYVKRAGQNPEGQGSMFGPSKTPGEVLRETIASSLGTTIEKPVASAIQKEDNKSSGAESPKEKSMPTEQPESQQQPKTLKEKPTTDSVKEMGEVRAYLDSTAATREFGVESVASIKKEMDELDALIRRVPSGTAAKIMGPASGRGAGFWGSLGLDKDEQKKLENGLRTVKEMATEAQRATPQTGEIHSVVGQRIKKLGLQPSLRAGDWTSAQESAERIAEEVAKEMGGGEKTKSIAQREAVRLVEAALTAKPAVDAPPKGEPKLVIPVETKEEQLVSSKKPYKGTYAKDARGNWIVVLPEGRDAEIGDRITISKRDGSTKTAWLASHADDVRGQKAVRVILPDEYAGGEKGALQALREAKARHSAR